MEAQANYALEKIDQSSKARDSHLFTHTHTPRSGRVRSPGLLRPPGTGAAHLADVPAHHQRLPPDDVQRDHQQVRGSGASL